MHVSDMNAKYLIKARFADQIFLSNVENKIVVILELYPTYMQFVLFIKILKSEKLTAASLIIYKYMHI